MRVGRRVRLVLGLVVLLTVGNVGVLGPQASGSTPQKPTPPPKPSVAVFPKSPWYPGESLSVLVQCHPGATNIRIEALLTDTGGNAVYPGKEIGKYAGAKPQTLWAAGYTVSSAPGGLVFAGNCMQDGQKTQPTDAQYRGTVAAKFDPNAPTVIQPTFLTPDPYNVHLYPLGTASVPFTGTCNSTAVQPGPGSVQLTGGALDTEYFSKDLGGGKSNFAGQIPVPTKVGPTGTSLPWIIPAQVMCLSKSPPYPYNSKSQGGSYDSISQPLWLEIYDPSSSFIVSWSVVGSLASQFGMFQVLHLGGLLTPQSFLTTGTTTTAPPPTTRPKSTTTTLAPTTTSTTMHCPPGGIVPIPGCP